MFVLFGTLNLIKRSIIIQTRFADSHRRKRPVFKATCQTWLPTETHAKTRTSESGSILTSADPVFLVGAGVGGVHSNIQVFEG